MNAELQRLYGEDQEDRRRAGTAIGDALRDRDRARRARVEEMLLNGEVRDGIDYHNAALIFHHGETLDDYWRAHELAKMSADLGYRYGRSLAAYALDRWLLKQGKPQKYGTQWEARDGRWVLQPVDPATTDAERAAWDVPSVEEQERMMLEAYGAPGPREEERRERDGSRGNT